MGWEEKLDRARRLHRPSLENWHCDGLYEMFPAFVESLLPQESHQALVLSEAETAFPSSSSSRAQHELGSIPAVLDARTLSKETFWKEYEKSKIPCLISHIPQVCGWGAVARWQLDALDRNDQLRNRVFKCGEDDDGKSIKVKLKHFLKYLRYNRDDSPLYIFDSNFDDDKHAKKLLADYQVPCYFQDDLFCLVSESRRPPYRWFLVGPRRSGTTLHIDPLATSAWNTLLVGKKRWVLFPPHVPKHVAKGKGLIRKDEDDEAIHYFMTILPRIKRKAAVTGSFGDYRDFACYEFTQNAGDTVFVPNGWWHAVLNLTDTVGITQNYVSPRNFNDAWIKTRVGRKRMAWKWLCQLDEHYPVLAHRARAINERDAFVMKYDPVEIQRREDTERERREKKAARQREQDERLQHQRGKMDGSNVHCAHGYSNGTHMQESGPKRSRIEHRQPLSCS